MQMNDQSMDELSKAMAAMKASKFNEDAPEARQTEEVVEKSSEDKQTLLRKAFLKLAMQKKLKGS